jgi:N6-L-threonylcarbamoyladenine synthase
VVSSQGVHDAYGGVVPEVASRHHLELANAVVDDALARANATLDDVDLVAVTQGPGLAGALLVGVATAKGLAAARGLALAPVDHLQGHVAANFLRRGDGPVEPPFLCLIASGGHSLLVRVTDHEGFEVLGRTLDDAAGEAFDKVGRLLDLPYPGGPAISAAAEGATPATRFPRARTDGAYDFSFSGLKTAVLREVQGYRERGEPIPVDGIAAAFEEAVVDALATKTLRAARDHGVASVALGGGVAANHALRGTLDARLAADGLQLRVPPPAWCTDNGAMIGAAAAHRFAAGDRADASLEAVPNLSLPWLENA